MVCSMLAWSLSRNSAKNRFFAAPVRSIPVGQATSRSTGSRRQCAWVWGASNLLHRTMIGGPTKYSSGNPKKRWATFYPKHSSRFSGRKREFWQLTEIKGTSYRNNLSPAALRRYEGTGRPLVPSVRATHSQNLTAMLSFNL